MFTPFSPQFRGVQLLVVTVLSHRYNSRTGWGGRRSRAMRPPKHNPTKPHCFLTQCASNPENQPHQCVGGNTVRLATWSACTAPVPPQESLVRQGYPYRPNPPLTQTTMGQLCAAPWVSWSRPAATEPGLEPGSLVAQLAL